MIVEPPSNFLLQSLIPTLPLQIADQIATSIVEERLKPGERLKEIEIAAAFKVSRATIREALRLLESRGLVSIIPQRGAYVTMLSRHELEELFDIRIVLLGLASRTLASRYTPAAGAQLEAGLAGLEVAVDDAHKYARASAALTLLIAKLSGNSRLREHIESFAQPLRRYALLGFVTQARREQSLRKWKRLLKAIAARDGELAESLHRRLSSDNRDAALAELDRRENQKAFAKKIPQSPRSKKRVDKVEPRSTLS